MSTPHLNELLAAATPGPYSVHECPALDETGATALEIDIPDQTIAHFYPSEEMDATAALLILARSHLPSLVKRLQHTVDLADDGNFAEACALLPELEAVVTLASADLAALEKAAREMRARTR